MMHKVSIHNNGEFVEFIVNRSKLVIGRDYEVKNTIIKMFLNKFNKVGNSDYCENNYSNKLMIDEEDISISDYDFFYVNSRFNLNDDLKLGTKSLSLRYLNALFDNIEYEDTFQTVNILLTDLIENLISDEESSIIPNIGFQMTKKHLVKLIEMSFLKDDEEINNYDLSLKEKISLQLNLIKTITKTSNKRIIILYDSPFLDVKDYDLINTISDISILLIESTNVNVCKDFYLSDFFHIDLLDDNSIYEVCFEDNDNHITIGEMKDKLVREYLIPRIFK